MQLQQVVTTWTHRTNALLVVKSIGLDISHIVVAKIWSKWTTTFLMMVETIQHIQKTQTQTKKPSTYMEGWNTTWLGMPNTILVEV